MLRRVGGALAVVSLCLVVAHGQPSAPDTRIPTGANVFIAHFVGYGFEQDLKVAIVAARIPVVLVKDRRAADFEITGRQVRKQSNGFRSDWVEEASLTVAEAKTGAIVDAFTLTKADTRSLAAACALRFDDEIGIVRNVQPPSPQSAVQPPPDGSSVRLFIQGDVKHLSDFAQVFRSELQHGFSAGGSVGNAARDLAKRLAAAVRGVR
jgi:hypothetical protein